MPFSHGCCINEDKSGLSVGFFFKHLSTKSLMESEKIFLGNFGAGWLTIYSNNSKMAMDLTPGDLGVLGVLGWGEIKLSSKIWGPKSFTCVDVSGGGMGYIPKLISNKERPRDHKSLATEYCDPYNRISFLLMTFYKKMKLGVFGLYVLSNQMVEFEDGWCSCGNNTTL